jgi:hypothetical protein
MQFAQTLKMGLASNIEYKGRNEYFSFQDKISRHFSQTACFKGEWLKSCRRTTSPIVLWT